MNDVAHLPAEIIEAVQAAVSPTDDEYRRAFAIVGMLIDAGELPLPDLNWEWQERGFEAAIYTVAQTLRDTRR